MKYLAIDTSSSHLTVYIFNDGERVVLHNQNCNLKHSIMLMDMVEEALQKANLTISDIDAFACSVGPGSFTGIRIGISTVKALAFSLNKKVIGVSTFEILAYNSYKDSVFYTVVDAKHDNLYVGKFENGVLTQKSFMTVEELKLSSESNKIYGDTEIENLSVITVDQVEGFQKAVDNKILLADLDREKLVPLYIRKSQAEENI